MFEDLELCRKEADGKLPNLSIQIIRSQELCEIDAASARGAAEMNEQEELDPLSPCTYIGVGQEEEEEQQQQQQQNQKNITAKFVQIAPKIFASDKQLASYIKGLSENEVDALEYWSIQLRKRCREAWKNKRFPSDKEAWLEMMRQRRAVREINID